MAVGSSHEQTRVLYARLALAATAFAVCGSLAPFHFELVPVESMFQRFRDALALSTGMGSVSDFIANVLLMMPIGFFAVGALRPASAPWRVIAAVFGTAIAGAALSSSLEFIQAFLPVRVVSLEDVAAQTAGTVLGALTFAVFGRGISDRLRQSALGRDRLSDAERWLLGYVVLLALWQLMPLDLTLEPAELFHKYREGRLVTGLTLSPAELSGQQLGLMAAAILIYMPVGVAAALLWRPRGHRRPAPVALALAMTTVAALAVSRLFVETRSIDLQEALAGAIGAAAGAAAATVLSLDVPAARTPDAFRPFLACVAWAAAIVSLQWYPFNFISDGAEALVRIQRLASVSSIAAGNTVAVAGTFLMTLPIGVCVRRALGREARISGAVVGLVMLSVAGLWCGVEFGVALLPSGAPALGQVPVATLGAIAGLWLGGLELSHA